MKARVSPKVYNYIIGNSAYCLNVDPNRVAVSSSFRSSYGKTSRKKRQNPSRTEIIMP